MSVVEITGVEETLSKALTRIAAELKESAEAGDSDFYDLVLDHADTLEQLARLA